MADAEIVPDNTAVRVALWRALHVRLDAEPHVLDDEVGLALADPDPGWERRRDMHPTQTARNRASIVARGRFVDDLVAERAESGVAQFVVLGAGLDTFAQRRLDGTAGPGGLDVFEIDQPATQAWKRQRLADLALPLPDSLHFVPVDFEAGDSWTDALSAAGFDASAPSVVASTGVSVYLSRDTVIDTLDRVGAMASGTTLAMSFMIPLDHVDAAEQGALRGAERGARAGGTPWVTFFEPDDLVTLACDAGFTDVRHVAPADLAARYFAGRTDGLMPSSAEHLILASV